jgi:hypothetical protein
LQDQRSVLLSLVLEQAHHGADVYYPPLYSMVDPPVNNLTFFLILLNFQLSDQAYIYFKDSDELHRPLMEELQY